MAEQSEFDFDKKPVERKIGGGGRFPWNTKTPHRAATLTKKGLLGKDDVYRTFNKHWQDPTTGQLVRQYVFFEFVREQFEIKRSAHEYPRLNTFANREGMAAIFRVYGKKPSKKFTPARMYNGPPRPTPYLADYLDWTFPHMRITRSGIEYLIDVWPQWIMEYHMHVE